MNDKIKEVMELVSHYGLLVLDMATDEEDWERHADLIETKLRELVPAWLPIESAAKPAIGANGFGERILLRVDCGDGTLKSAQIGWWCNKWMMDTGGSVKENGYRAIGWMPLPKEPS